MALQVDKTDGIDTTETDGLKIQFTTNEAGEINAAVMTLEDGLKPMEFARKPKPKAITAAELKKYEGEYEMAPGAFAKIYVKGEKTLYAFVEGQPEYELVPTDKNKFVIKILSGYSLLFEEDDKGVITGLSFIQPNGTFKAKKK